MEPNYDNNIPATQFLSNLPKSNLDDREFNDLVEECLLRIPRYCPEWTNHNPSDPGITLIELFAWLVDQMLYRFNQVPRRNYVAFLELLGLRLEPPHPAKAEITFYLTRALDRAEVIAAGTEVATERTENQEAVIFTTDSNLVIGQPVIKHILLADQGVDRPDPNTLINRFSDPNDERQQQWESLERSLPLFNTTSCQPGNCFYVVLTPFQQAPDTQPISPDDTARRNRIEGNVLALCFKGQRAVTTGIVPDNPPLVWEVWTGERWQTGILRKPTDDFTKGFSFDHLGNAAPNPEQEGADVVLHMPQQWPVAQFGDYEGHWIRCQYTEPNSNTQQTGYLRSPEITGVSVRTIGGTITASECITMEKEYLGVSNGKAGQRFELEGSPVLQRIPGQERIQVVLPDDRQEDWQEYWTEVEHFGDSDYNSYHYTLDSKTGVVQFGPLIREPSQLKTQTRDRRQLQSGGGYSQGSEVVSSQFQSLLPAGIEAADRNLECQYGRVPPLGAKIYMTRYRVGGGERGNVQPERLKILKTAIPYVKRVVNHGEATGGRDGESLDKAIMRVPGLLRTRKTAITPEEFEQRACDWRKPQTTTQPIYRAHCVTAPDRVIPGKVYLLVIPHPRPPENAQPRNLQVKGTHPEDFLKLTKELQGELHAYLDAHRALGIQVEIDSPEYVGIRVLAQVELKLHPQTPRESEDLRQRLDDRLYRFFDPITGGLEGTGWPLGKSVRSYDVITHLQADQDVQYVVSVELYSLRRNTRDENAWVQVSGPETEIPFGPRDVACSWYGLDTDRPGHTILFLER